MFLNRNTPNSCVEPETMAGFASGRGCDRVHLVENDEENHAHQGKPHRRRDDRIAADFVMLGNPRRNAPGDDASEASMITKT